MRKISHYPQGEIGAKGVESMKNRKVIHNVHRVFHRGSKLWTITRRNISH